MEIISKIYDGVQARAAHREESEGKFKGILGKLHRGGPYSQRLPGLFAQESNFAPSRPSPAH
uniref:Uncharacterized protein n=1 Tax=Oryza rufipogon TaxID=4529 RepID=A0A0E0PK19_ORYRU